MQCISFQSLLKNIACIEVQIQYICMLLSNSESGLSELAIVFCCASEYHSLSYVGGSAIVEQCFWRCVAV